MPKFNRIETTVESARLIRAAKLCAGLSDARSPIPAYSSVLVRISHDGCDLTATDGQISARANVSIPPAGDQASFCVNAKRLLEVATRMPDGYLQIANGPTEATISSGPFGVGHAAAKLATTPAADYPVPIFPDAPTWVNREALAGALRAVTFAADQNGAGVRSQVQVIFDASGLWAWSTNGHIVASDSASMEKCPLAARALTVTAARFLLSALEGADCPRVGLLLADTSAFDFDGVVIAFRTEPANTGMSWFERIPPAAMRLECDRDELLAAVARAATFAHPDKANTSLVTSLEDAGIRVSTGVSVAGSASTLVPVTGDRIVLHTAASHRYLRDCLGAIDAERVALEFSDQPTMPIVVRAVGAGPKQLYLISPMTTD